MSDPLLSVLPAIARWMREYGDDYAVIGGLAVVLRARPRLTTDVDLMVRVPGDAIDRLLSTAGEQGFTWDEDEVREWAPGGLVRLLHTTGAGSGINVDVLFAIDDASQRAVERATMLSVAGCELPVVAAEDLILMKLEANRGQDLDDVIALRDAAGDELDRDYLEAGARELDLLDRLRVFVS